MLEKTPDQAKLEQARMLIDGKWTQSASGAVLPVPEPGEPPDRSRRSRAAPPRTCDRAVKAAAKAFPAWSKVAAARARPHAAAHRRGDGGAHRGTRPHHRARRPATRCAPRRGRRPQLTADIFRYFGGLGRRAEGRDDPARRARAELHAPRAARRGRRDHPVERAGAAGRAEDRAGAVRRQHAGAEGRRGRAAGRAADGARSARSSCRPACSTC